LILDGGIPPFCCFFGEWDPAQNEKKSTPQEKIRNQSSKMACVMYSFRLNLDKGTPEQITAWCNEWFKFWVFQGEKSDGDYEHWQGEGSLRKKRRPTEVIPAMQKTGGIVPNYIRPIPSEEAKSIKNVGHLMERYASKADTRISGPFKSITQDEFIPLQYRNKELKPWQQFVYDTGRKECDELDERHIHWIYDPTGQHGKSNLAALIELRHQGVDVPSLNDYKELCQALCNQLMDSNNRDPGIIMLDLPRAMPKNSMHGFTTAVEQFKKGKVVDGRNHYKAWWFNTPSVWVFSNSEPPLKDLSKDRWIVWTFDGPGCDANLIPFVSTNEITKDL